MAFQFNPLTGQFDLVGLTFPDLASPPSGTALGSSGTPFDSLDVSGTATLGDVDQDGTYWTHHLLMKIVNSSNATGLDVELYSTSEGEASYGGVFGTGATFSASTHNPGVLVGFVGEGLNQGSGTSPMTAGFWADGNFNSLTGTVLLNAGFISESMAGVSATLNAAFYAKDQGSGVHDYAFYAAGGKSLFNGTVTATDFLWSGTKVKNTLLAGPTSGSDAAPTFRTLVVADFNSGTGATSSTFWRGDGTWAAAGAGTVTSIATTSPISGGTITGTGTLSLLVNVDFAWTAGQTVTAPAGSTALTLVGGTQTSAFPALVTSQTNSATSGTFTHASLASTFSSGSTSTMVGVGLKVATTINYSAGTPGGGSYEAFKIVGVETALPTGTSYLIRASAGVAGTTDKFTLTNTGTVAIAGSFTWSGAVAGADGNYVYTPTLGLALRGGGSAFTTDTILTRDAARTPVFRDGTNAYKLKVYNTFTTIDTAGEWFAIDWITTANVVNLQAVKGSSSGTARVMTLSYGGAQASPVAAITIPITSGDIVFGGPVYPTGYKSSDGSAGVTAGPYTAITSITVKNGLITAITGT